MLGWRYLITLRILSVRRSGQGWRYRLGTLLSSPTAMIWATFLLQPVLFPGTATCLRQGWIIRTEGVEVAITPAAREASA